MDEVLFVLTEEQLNAALELAAMGGAGLLHPSNVADLLKKLPNNIGNRALASALAAGCIRQEGPIGALATILKMISEKEN